MPSSWFEPLPARATYQAEAHAESRAALAEAAAAACARTAPTLLAMQKPEGYWVGDLLADSTLESDYVLLQLWLYPPRDGEWKPPTWDRIQRARKAILARQKSDGGFNIYPDGPADVNATIKGYIALKLAGQGAHYPYIRELVEGAGDRHPNRRPSRARPRGTSRVRVARGAGDARGERHDVARRAARATARAAHAAWGRSGAGGR